MSANNQRAPLTLYGCSVASALLLAFSAAHADVTVYEKAPSVEELQQKLLGNKAEKKKFKTRAIVFDDGGQDESAAPQAEQAPQAAQAVEPAPAAAGGQTSARPAPAAAAPQATLQVSEDAIAFPIQFQVNSAQVLPQSVPFLQTIAGLMHKNAGLRLLIEGHTDISGNYQLNMKLSRDRANAVVNYLTNRYGIEPARLMPVGKGPAELLEGLEPTDPKHRRVQFRVIG